MQHEAAAHIDGAAEMHADVAAGLTAGDAELGEKIGEGEGADKAVYHQPHGALGIVSADINDAARKARIAHGRHGDQKLAEQVAVAVIVSHGFDLGAKPTPDKGECYTDSLCPAAVL